MRALLKKLFCYLKVTRHHLRDDGRRRQRRCSSHASDLFSRIPVLHGDRDNFDGGDDRMLHPCNSVDSLPAVGRDAERAVTGWGDGGGLLLVGMDGGGARERVPQGKP